MNSQQIEYVLVLAEERNFSKAAERLFVTQPALSQFIKNVESQVGMPLFDRSRNPIGITPVGQIYIEAAKDIRQSEREMERRIADLSNLQNGKFVLGTTSFRAACLLPKSISEYGSRYPGIHMAVITEHTGKLKQMLLEGEVDCCIEADSFNTTLFHKEDLFQETYYIAMPKELVKENGWQKAAITAEDIIHDSEAMYEKETVPLEAFNRSPFVITQKNGSMYHVFEEIMKETSFCPEKKMFVNQIEAAFLWSVSGLAATIVPDTLIRHGNYAKHPLYMKIEAKASKQSIVFATKKNRYITNAIREYINVLRELIGYGTWNAPK